MTAGHSTSRLRRARVAILVGLGAIVLSACGRQFAGVGVVQPYAGSECKSVLVVGDSLAYSMAPHLQARLAASGRCSTVVNRAWGGTSTGDWVGALGPIIDEVHPDVVVIEFIGNEGIAGPAWPDPGWLGISAQNAITITDAALNRGIKLYWAIPPVGAFYCQWGSLQAYWWPHWASWIRTWLPTVRPVGLIDWRTPFGGELYTATFVFPDGPRTLRQNDCVHMTYEGDEVAADATVVAIQHEWGAAAPPVPPLAVAVPAVPTTAPTVPEVPVPPTTLLPVPSPPPSLPQP